MHRARYVRNWILPLLMALLLCWTQPVSAQFGAPLGDGGDSKVQVSAQFTAGAGNTPGRLYVTATIQPGWHIYSNTQKGEGPIPTKIKVAEGQGVKVLGRFQAHPAPDEKVEELFGNLLVESHHDTVVWHAPIQFAPGVAPTNLRIKGAVWAQACSDNACLPPQDYAFTAVPGPGKKVPAEQLIGGQSVPHATSMGSPGEQLLSRPSPFPPVVEPTVPEVDSPETPPVPSGNEQESGKLKWHPYTNMEDFSAIVGTKGVAFDPEEVSANLKKKQETKTLPLVLLGAFFWWSDSQPDAVRSARDWP